MSPFLNLPSIPLFLFILMMIFPLFIQGCFSTVVLCHFSLSQSVLASDFNRLNPGNLLAAFPDLRLPQEQNIQDFSKADAFTKGFACVQSVWLMVQSIARASQGLPITQLELSTIDFVICALIMYLLWWEKPFGVEQRFGGRVMTIKMTLCMTLAGMCFSTLLS